MGLRPPRGVLLAPPMGSPTTLILAILQIGIFHVSGEIRCYCNLPLCVSTGYMCKSAANTCFSELTSQSDVTRSRHGCLELMHRSKRELCMARMRNAKVPVGNFPLLLCCPEDMCNYVDNLDLRIQVNTKGNQTYTSGVTGEDGSYYYTHEAALRQDLWFKAAVIAVPIAGGFILIMLVLLAVRMLKKDSQRQREILELRRQRQLKAQLLLNDHFGEYYTEKHEHYPDKNEANAQLNQLDRQANIYRNVNIALSRDHCFSDKQYIYSKPMNNTFCTSFVSWGKINWKSSTPV